MSERASSWITFLGTYGVYDETLLKLAGHGAWSSAVFLPESKELHSRLDMDVVILVGTVLLQRKV